MFSGHQDRVFTRVQEAGVCVFSLHGSWGPCREERKRLGGVGKGVVLKKRVVESGLRVGGEEWWSSRLGGGSGHRGVGGEMSWRRSCWGVVSEGDYIQRSVVF